MIITDVEPCIVEVNARGDWVFVLVRTDTGITGLGEASHSGNDALLVAVLGQFKARLTGEDSLRIESIWHSLNRPNAGRVWQTALSGLEQALWDIMGQYLGVPIRTLFGGAGRESLRMYANINRHVTERTPEGFARAAQLACECGYSALKLAPFDEVCTADRVRAGPCAAWRPGVDRVRAVREAVGEKVELAVDCHGRLEPSEAILVGQALADCHLLWLEDPVPDGHPDDMAYIGRALSMAIASGESLFALEGFRPFLLSRVVDILMPDVKHDGGLKETKHIAEAARMSGLLVAPHNPSGPVATAATAQAVSTVSNFLILEYAWGEVDWRAELLEPPERIVDGALVLPEGAGLGHRLNERVLLAHRKELPSSADFSRVTPR